MWMEEISYEDIKEKIIRNQQLLQFQQEIIYIAILLGLLINISSSIIYDTIIFNYEYKLIVVPIIFALIIIIFYVLFKYIIKSDSEINILHLTYNPFFNTPFDGEISNKIKNQLLQKGISKVEYDLIYRQFEHAIKKIVFDGKIYNLGNKINKITINEDDIREIIIDVSNKGVKSYMDILIKPQGYPLLFMENDKYINDYYTIDVEVNIYLSNPRNKNALNFLKDIYKKREQILSTIKTAFIIILAHNMKFTEADHVTYNLIRYFDIENIK